MKFANTVAHLDSDIIYMLLESRVGQRQQAQSHRGRVEFRREPHPLPPCRRPDSVVTHFILLEEIQSSGFQTVKDSAMTSVLRVRASLSSLSPGSLILDMVAFRMSLLLNKIQVMHFVRSLIIIILIFFVFVNAGCR